MIDPQEETVDRLMRALLALDEEGARACLRDAGSSTAEFGAAVGLITPALDRIGLLWETGEVALSQVYMGGRICERLVDELLPPAAAGRRNSPRMAVAVLEDYHLLGKRIVYSQIRASGHELTDLGRMEIDPLVDAVRRERTEVLLVSTLMLASALRVRDLREALDREAPGTRLLVGGAPFLMDPDLWRRVGACATARDGIEALQVIAGWSKGGAA